MTLMEPPRFLALFNQPLPRQTNGRRDVTNTPDQALALLNDPFVVEAARLWSLSLVIDNAPDVRARAARMLETALSRPADPEEITALTQLLQHTASLRSVPPEQLLTHQPAWQDAAHAVLNLKEFLYVP
jgi:predicted metal-dependent HD superfamily phosphohydrolase